MTGREEHELKIDLAIREKIKKYPMLLNDYYVSMYGKTAQTKRMYVYNVCKFFDYVKSIGCDSSSYLTYKRMRPSDINRYLEYERYSNAKGSTRKREDCTCAVNYYAVSNFFDFLINEGYLDSNPFNRVTPPKDKKQRKITSMTSDEVSHIKDNITYGVGTARQRRYNFPWGKRDYAILTLGCRTGLRVAAISEINIGDINFDELDITVTEKENVTRSCKIDQDTAKILKEWIADREQLMKGYDPCDALFISNRRKRMCANSIEYMIKKYTADIDKKITPHKMRSTCATTLYEETNDIYLVAEVLGHNNLSNTRRYTKASDANRRKAAEILSSKL